MNLTDGANFIRQNRNYIELDMYNSVKQLVKFNRCFINISRLSIFNQEIHYDPHNVPIPNWLSDE